MIGSFYKRRIINKFTTFALKISLYLYVTGDYTAPVHQSIKPKYDIK